MLERLLFLLILINTSVDCAACVRLFRNIIFLLHVSKQRRNPAVSLKTVSLFSLVRFWFPVICRILVLLPKAANRGAYYTNSRTLYVCVREANNMRIRKEKSARKRVCVCACIGVCVCVKQRQTVCVFGEQCGQAADIIHLPVTGPRAAGKVADSSLAMTTEAAS